MTPDSEPAGPAARADVTAVAIGTLPITATALASTAAERRMESSAGAHGWCGAPLQRAERPILPATRRGSGRTGLTQALEQQLADPAGVGGASGGGHHGPDQRAQRALVAAADLVRGVRVGGDGGIDGSDELVLARDLPPVRLDDRVRLALTGDDGLGDLAGQLVRESPLGLERTDARHLRRRDTELSRLATALVGDTHQVAEPPSAGAARRCAGRDRLLHQTENAGVGHLLHVQRREAVGLGEATTREARRLRQGGPQPLHVLGGGSDRHEVGFGEVAVVLRLLLAAPGTGGAGVLVEVAGLLHDALAGFESRTLSLHLVADGALHTPKRVDVLRLRAGAELLTPFGHEREVDVAAQAALLHPYVGNPQSAEEVPQLGDVGACDSGGAVAGAGHGPRDDLDERDAGAVVVHQRVRSTVDPSGRSADVEGLPGVLLEMHALDLHAVGLSLQLDVEVAVDAERLVVLRDLVVLRHVGIEVVLAGEPAPRRDAAVEREPDPDGVVDRLLVRHRKAAGKTETDRADLRVGLSPDLRRTAAEQLGRRPQPDVSFQADDRVVAVQDLFVRRQRRGRRHARNDIGQRASPSAVELRQELPGDRRAERVEAGVEPQRLPQVFHPGAGRAERRLDDATVVVEEGVAHPGSESTVARAKRGAVVTGAVQRPCVCVPRLQEGPGA